MNALRYTLGVYWYAVGDFFSVPPMWMELHKITDFYCEGNALVVKWSDGTVHDILIERLRMPHAKWLWDHGDMRDFPWSVPYKPTLRDYLEDWKISWVNLLQTLKGICVALKRKYGN